MQNQMQNQQAQAIAIRRLAAAVISRWLKDVCDHKATMDSINQNGFDAWCDILGVDAQKLRMAFKRWYAARA